MARNFIFVFLVFSVSYQMALPAPPPSPPSPPPPPPELGKLAKLVADLRITQLEADLAIANAQIAEAELSAARANLSMIRQTIIGLVEKRQKIPRFLIEDLQKAAARHIQARSTYNKFVVELSRLVSKMIGIEKLIRLMGTRGGFVVMPFLRGGGTCATRLASLAGGFIIMVEVGSGTAVVYYYYRYGEGDLAELEKVTYDGIASGNEISRFLMNCKAFILDEASIPKVTIPKPLRVPIYDPVTEQYYTIEEILDMIKALELMQQGPNRTTVYPPVPPIYPGMPQASTQLQYAK